MITSAACRAIIHGKPMVLRCHRHCDFFETMKLLDVAYDKSSVEQGFIDWDENQHIERFVSRQEAAKIAIKNNQILLFNL